MRFAAIADIHGNRLALEAVLADAARIGIHTVVNLGDHLSGPLEAGRTADLLMARGDLAIRGNHDRWLVEVPDTQMGPSDKAASAQLGRHHRDWLAALPATAVFRDEVFLCHGTPASDTTYWLESVTDDAVVHMATLENIEAEAVGLSYPLILCAHTHIPRIVRLGDGRLVVNPGSVGCPGYDDISPVFHVMQSGTPDACYAVLEKSGNRWTAGFRYVSYDSAAMAEMARRNGRQEWASALATGWIR
ncbi:MAG: metallophosphoesterase family protein [Inquilinaceae bacterium]